MAKEKEKNRYRIVVDIEGESYVFKRYGSDESAVKKVMNMFMKENMPEWHYDIVGIEKDKTRTIGSCP